MKMIIEYAGKRYESKDDKKATARQQTDALYAYLDIGQKLEMELKDGGFLLLGKNAIQSCAIQILDT